MWQHIELVLTTDLFQALNFPLISGRWNRQCWNANLFLCFGLQKYIIPAPLCGSYALWECALLCLPINGIILIICRPTFIILCFPNIRYMDLRRAEWRPGRATRDGAQEVGAVAAAGRAAGGSWRSIYCAGNKLLQREIWQRCYAYRKWWGGRLQHRNSVWTERREITGYLYTSNTCHNVAQDLTCHIMLSYW